MPKIATGLLLMVVLLTATVTGQQPGDQRKKIPAMSSEDVDAAPSAMHPTVGSSSEASPAGLTRYTLEGCGLSIALPAAPVDSEVELAGADRHLMGPVKTHLSVGHGYAVFVSHFLPPGKSGFEGRLDEVVEGVFWRLSHHPAYSNVKYTMEDKSTTEVSFRGSFDVRGVPEEIEGFARLQGRHGWLVGVFRPMANAAAIEPASKVLASAKLDGPPCPQ